MKHKPVSQSFVWDRMNAALKHVTKETKKEFVPKYIIRKNNKFTNNIKVG